MGRLLDNIEDYLDDDFFNSLVTYKDEDSLGIRLNEFLEIEEDCEHSLIIDYYREHINSFYSNSMLLLNSINFWYLIFSFLFEKSLFKSQNNQEKLDKRNYINSILSECVDCV